MENDRGGVSFGDHDFSGDEGGDFYTPWEKTTFLVTK